MNTCIDVIANFNCIGKIRPLFLRMEDEEHQLHSYKILGVTQEKEEYLSGISACQFRCLVELEGQEREVFLRYHYQSHKWALIR